MSTPKHNSRLTFVRLGLTGLTIALATIAIGSILVLLVHATEGDLDPTFGDNGIVFPPISNSNDQGNSIALQSDGKIIVAGYTGSSGNYDFVMSRYSNTGNPDPSFGSGGRITTDFSGANDVGLAIAVQKDDKIIVVGSADNSNFGLARYNSDGNLDAGFGVGGKVTTSIGSGGSCNAVVVQLDDKIVVGGDVYNGTSDDFALARYTITGTLDTTFGNGGIVTTSIGSGYDYGKAIAIQSDRKIVIAGASWGNNDNYDFALARYSSTGSLDTAFGSSGIITADFDSDDWAQAIALQPDGKIIVAGDTYKEIAPGVLQDLIALARYTPDGALDVNFGHGGIVTTSTSYLDAGSDALILQPDNKIIVTGEAGGDFALVRYNPNGSLDSTFGNGGIVTTDLGAHKWVQNGEAVLQHDGKIVMAGTAWNETIMVGFALARYVAPLQLTEHIYLPVVLK